MVLATTKVFQHEWLMCIVNDGKFEGEYTSTMGSYGYLIGT